MRTRSSSNLVGKSYPNPTTSNLKRHNRRRSKQPFMLEESPVDTMADQRTMAEFLRAPTDGYAEAIVVLPSLAEHFELKHSLINMMTSDQFFELEKDNPHDHIRWFNKITFTIKYKDVPNLEIKLMLFPFSLAGAAHRWLKKEPPRSILTWEDLDLLRTCPHHGFTELHQLDTFCNALNHADQDSLNSVAGGNLLERCTQDVLTIIENKSKVRNSRNKSIVSQVKSSDANSSSSSEIAKLTHAVNQQTSACLVADGNTFSKFRDNIQGYVSAAAVNYNQDNFVVPLSELEKIKKMNEINIKAMQTQINNVKNELRNEMKTLIQASMSNQTNELKNMMASFFQMNTDSTSGSGSLPSNTIINPKGELKAITTRSGLVLDGSSIPMPSPFINPKEDERAEETLTDSKLAEYTIKMLKALLSNKEKLLELENTPLNENWSTVILKKLPEKLGDPGKFLILCGFSVLKCKSLAALESINMINIYNDSYKEYLEDLFAKNHLSGNPTFSSHTDLTSPEVINPLSGNTTFSSFPDHLLEEFTDELTLITFPPGNDDLPFDIESDLREIEYLLNHDPTKEMDSILEDSVDECNLADPNNDLSDNDDVYDDPFDSKEDKIKESKLLINELDPPRSSDFLPSPEYESILYEHFSKVDDLPSTNNEDKVFNPGILIQENLFEATVQVTPDKNVKKISISNASLIFEDFNPPLYELPFHKEVPGSEILLSFSSENEE
nr:hypothetical protein [Tanacetum cinerariifolium]